MRSKLSKLLRLTNNCLLKVSGKKSRTNQSKVRERRRKRKRKRKRTKKGRKIKNRNQRKSMITLHRIAVEAEVGIEDNNLVVAKVSK